MDDASSTDTRKTYVHGQLQPESGTLNCPFFRSSDDDELDSFRSEFMEDMAYLGLNRGHREEFSAVFDDHGTHAPLSSNIVSRDGNSLRIHAPYGVYGRADELGAVRWFRSGRGDLEIAGSMLDMEFLVRKEYSLFPGTLPSLIDSMRTERVREDIENLARGQEWEGVYLSETDDV
eukprot:TRINITY_DN59513_c0_g1_i1.p1 TRINITY_DN59513_c0_g1~~TRINITY_DN59513_c0_g1_i1.p1  ORF type:complete len:176 (+),score=2.41 TRINITY_DN59513_c0_g1_i1:31-558(+)